MAQQFQKVTTSPDDTEGIILSIESEMVETKIAVKETNAKPCQKTNSLILLLITIAILLLCGAFVIFYFNNFTEEGKENEHGTEPVSSERCNGLHCCQSKDSNINIDCSSLNIVQCTLNDDSCVWDCEAHLRGRSFKNYKFIKFDDGTNSSNNNISVSFTSKSTLYQTSRCGDVYEIELDAEIAESRLNNAPPARSSYASQIANDLNHRRLWVIGTDDRSQITTADEWSNKIAIIISTDIGHCTGTLISKRQIITAAHCVYDTKNNHWIYPEHIYLGRIGSNTGTDYAWSVMTIDPAYVALPRVYSGYDTDAEIESMVSVDWAVITLQTTNTGRGWYAFGHDPGMTANPSPLFVMRQHPNEEDEMWIGACSLVDAGTHFFKSNCDTDGGSSGSGLVKLNAASPFQVVYGTHSSKGTAQYNYEHRLDATEFDWICDVINDCAVCNC